MKSYLPVALTCVLFGCAASPKKLRMDVIDESYRISEVSKTPFENLLLYATNQKSIGNKDRFIFALSLATRVQTNEIPDNALLMDNDKFITKIKDQDERLAADFLNKTISNEYRQAYKLLPSLSMKAVFRYGLSQTMAKVYYKNGDVNNGNRWLVNAKDDESFYGENYLLQCRRNWYLDAIKYYKSSDGSESFLQAASSIAPLSEYEFLEIYRYLTKRKDYSSAANAILIAPSASEADGIDSMVLTILKESDIVFNRNGWIQELWENGIVNRNTLSSYVYKFELSDAAKKIVRSINENSRLSNEAIKFLCLALQDSLPNESARIAGIPFQRDTIGYLPRVLKAKSLALTRSHKSAMEILRPMVKQYSDSMLIQTLYLEQLIEDFNINSLVSFLNYTKKSIDSVEFTKAFLDIYDRALEAKSKNFSVWKNGKGEPFWVYPAENGNWLYNKWFQPTGMQLFVNTKDEEMVWLFNDGKQWLLNSELIYKNVFRWLDSTGSWNYGIQKNGKTFYHNSDLEFSGTYSYLNGSGKSVFVKVSGDYEYFYDDGLNYMNIYSYVSGSNEKFFFSVDGIRTSIYDSTWNYTGISSFNVSGYKPIYSFISQSGASLYFENDESKWISLGIRLFKNAQGQTVVEKSLGNFNYYYNEKGQYLGFYTWLENGSIRSITVTYQSGACEQYFVGLRDISACNESNTRQNLFLQDKYLSEELISSASNLTSVVQQTPFDLFVEIRQAILNRQEQEKAAARAQAWAEFFAALGQASQNISNSYRNSYSSYTSSYQPKTYSSSYTSNTNLYSRLSSYQNNSSSNSTITSYGSDGYYGYGNINRTRNRSSLNYYDNTGNYIYGNSSTVGRSTYSNVYSSDGYWASANSYNYGRSRTTSYYDNQGNYGSQYDQKIGNTTYSNYHGTDGYSLNSNTRKSGNTSYFSAYDNEGNYYHGTSQKIGNFIYHNYYGPNGESLSGSTNKVGNSINTNLNYLK